MRPKLILCVATPALMGALAAPAEATNGLYALGFGLESLAMAGADVAVARDPLALNTNPAGLAQLTGTRIEAQGAVVHELRIEHADRFNPPTDAQNDYFPVGNLAVSHRLDALPLTLGASLVASGGAGFDYGRIDTAFGTKDRLSSTFGIAEATVGGGAELADGLALGIGISLSYSRLDQEFFPETSVLGPSGPFFGTRIENAWAYGAGFRLGLRWQPLDRLAFGLTYRSKVDLPVDDGRIDVDMTAVGLGRVRYHDLKLDGLAQAREVVFGAAFQLTPDWLVAADLAWIDWSGALGTTTIRASDPDRAQAPDVVRFSTTQDWRDQYVLALGTAYRPVPPLTLWAGYNYGRNPVPSRHLSPLLANIGEQHLTAGVGWQTDPDLRLGLAVEYLLPNRVTYDNPELPFGPDARARVSYVALHFGLSWRL